MTKGSVAARGAEAAARGQRPRVRPPDALDGAEKGKGGALKGAANGGVARGQAVVLQLTGVDDLDHRRGALDALLHEERGGARCETRPGGHGVSLAERCRAVWRRGSRGPLTLARRAASSASMSPSTTMNIFCGAGSTVGAAGGRRTGLRRGAGGEGEVRGQWRKRAAPFGSGNPRGCVQLARRSASGSGLERKGNEARNGEDERRRGRPRNGSGRTLRHIQVHKGQRGEPHTHTHAHTRTRTGKQRRVAAQKKHHPKFFSRSHFLSPTHVPPARGSASMAAALQKRRCTRCGHRHDRSSSIQARTRRQSAKGGREGQAKGQRSSRGKVFSLPFEFFRQNRDTIIPVLRISG